jgi:hypothetical protein
MMFAISLALIGSRGWVFFSLVPVVQDHGGDAGRRCPAQRVQDDKELDEVVVDRMAGWLHQKDIVAADRLTDLDIELAVGEAGDLQPGELHADLAGDALAELGIPAPGEQQELAVGVRVAHGPTGRLAAHSSMLRWRVRPTARAPAGTSRSTNDPAPIYAPSPSRRKTSPAP